MALTDQSWTQIWLQDLGSLPQRKYELAVNKIKEIIQRLVELDMQ